jgi:hypothetical protein
VAVKRALVPIVEKTKTGGFAKRQSMRPAALVRDGATGEAGTAFPAARHGSELFATGPFGPAASR